MDDSKPRGNVEHPWLVLIAFVLACAALGSLFSRPMCVHPICSDTKVRADITVIREALESYALQHEGAYPTSLEALVAPDELGHRYLNVTKLPRDPWRREYVYIASSPPNVLTYGRDGVPGGDDDDADVDYASISAGR